MELERVAALPAEPRWYLDHRGDYWCSACAGDTLAEFVKKHMQAVVGLYVQRANLHGATCAGCGAEREKVEC